MATAEALFPPFEITLRGDNKYRFKTYAELRAFWAAEREGFRPIVENTRVMQTNPGATSLTTINQKYQAIEAQMREAKQQVARYPGELNADQTKDIEPRLKVIAANIASALQTNYAPGAKGLWLTSEPAAQFVLELAKTNADEAAYAFLHLRGGDFESQSAVSRSGSFKAQLFEANITKLRVNAETKAIELLKNSWKTDLEAMKAETAAERSTARVLNEQHTKEIQAQQEAAQKREEAFKEFMDSGRQMQGKQLEDADADLDKLVATYDEHMKLQAPVAYWKDKKLRHLAERRSLQRWAIFVGLGSFAILGLYVLTNFHEGPAGKVPWREIVGFFVLSTLSFWAMKILVRLLLSAIHLAEDAAEREVMAMTYMALVRGDESNSKYLDEKDRALVLAPLFRPSSTGVIDDGAPPHVSEIIAKLGRR